MRCGNGSVAVIPGSTPTASPRGGTAQRLRWAKVTTYLTGQGIRETDKGAKLETNRPNNAKPTIGR